MTIQQLASQLSDAKFDYECARSKGTMIPRHREILRNVLETDLDEIMKALEFAANAEKQIEVLTQEIEDADAELALQDKEIKELKAALEATAKKPAKKKADEAVEQ